MKFFCLVTKTTKTSCSSNSYVVAFQMGRNSLVVIQEGLLALHTYRSVINQLYMTQCVISKFIGRGVSFSCARVNDLGVNGLPPRGFRAISSFANWWKPANYIYIHRSVIPHIEKNDLVTPLVRDSVAESPPPSLGANIIIAISYLFCFRGRAQ